MTSLTIVTIIKNAERRIKSVVNNALQLGDEHIVVDTGSSDDTAEIAAEAGARVIEYDNIFDYSSPRNVGTEAASGEWVLHLDTDERIDVRYRSEIQRLISDAAFPVYRVLQLTRRQIMSQQPRLFRKNGFHHEGLVHEWVYPVCNHSYANIFIDHQRLLGGNGQREFRQELLGIEVESLSKKLQDATCEEDLALIVSRCSRLFSLGDSSQRAGLVALTQQAYTKGQRQDLNSQFLREEIGYFTAMMMDEPREALAILNELTLSTITSPMYFRAMAQAYRRASDPTGLDALDHALRLDETAAEFHFLRADVLFHDLGEQEEGEKALKHARELFPEHPCHDRNFFEMVYCLR